MEALFQGSCVEYMDIVYREEMIRCLRACAATLNDDATTKKLEAFENPVHDIASFEFVVMQQAVNLVSARYSMEEIQEAMLELAAFLDAHEELFDNGLLTATGSISAGVQLREICEQREREEREMN